MLGFHVSGNVNKAAMNMVYRRLFETWLSLLLGAYTEIELLDYYVTPFKVFWWWWCSCQVVSNSCDPMDCSLPGFSDHGFPRQEYWSGLPFPSRGTLPDPEIEPTFPSL
ncbi:unnamed protein product [Rangifer tarandus platyrhynchus]|uniref:Uncharacterized protein n=2 Tax=Rangifer tarandus platyrhynchus TaxID=3082113 RepID=A0ABN8Y1D0_RANTA|nr:unnamed protein product [Rangifer tarandus platyrhynchus]